MYAKAAQRGWVAAVTLAVRLQEAGDDAVHGGVRVRCDQDPCSAQRMISRDLLQLHSDTMHSHGAVSCGSGSHAAALAWWSHLSSP